MSLSALLTVSGFSAAAMMILLFYAPITSRMLWMRWSPRLALVWLIPALDICVTLYLIAGNWFGLGHTIGIMATMVATATAFGLSVMAIIIRKLLAPRWRRQHEANIAGGNKHYNSVLRQYR